MSYRDDHDDAWGNTVVDNSRANGTGKLPIGVHKPSQKLNSSRGLIMRNGELVAITHPTSRREQKPPTILEATGSLDRAAAAVSGSSTYRASFCNQGMMYDPNAAKPGDKKPLTRYHPNAPRNRLKTDTKVMDHPNKHTVEFTDNSRQAAKYRFKTQYNVAYTGQGGPIPANFTSNQGILSEKVKWLHTQQNK